jgi:hypothetical protein
MLILVLVLILVCYYSRIESERERVARLESY